MSGVQPLPRTFHTSSAAVGDCLYVFGGGDKGAEPVQDQQLHVFDTGTSGCTNCCSVKRWNPSIAEQEVCDSDSVKAMEMLGPCFGYKSKWMGGCSLLLTCTYFYVVTGTLGQNGSVKLWAEKLMRDGNGFVPFAQQLIPFPDGIAVCCSCTARAVPFILAALCAQERVCFPV